MGRRIGPKIFGPDYHELHYESLISNPENELRAICRFLDLEFEIGMLDFADSGRKLVARDEMSWKKESAGPLLSTNTGKWRKSLRNWETHLAERVCREAFDHAGYPRAGKDIPCSITTRAATATLALPLQILEPIYIQWRLHKQN